MIGSTAVVCIPTSSLLFKYHVVTRVMTWNQFQQASVVPVVPFDHWVFPWRLDQGQPNHMGFGGLDRPDARDAWRCVRAWKRTDGTTDVLPQSLRPEVLGGVVGLCSP